MEEDPRPQKILIVDDDPGSLKTLETALEKKGYTVTTAGDGNTAAGILERDGIQVVFTDLKMPGMDGLELCRHVKKDHPFARVYAMTAHTSLFEVAECLKTGFDDYFVKPVDITQLLKTAELAFDQLERWTNVQG